MVRSAMLSVLVYISLLSSGIMCLEAQPRSTHHAGALELPWQDELCCDSPSAQPAVDGNVRPSPETHRTESTIPHNPHCNFKSLAPGSSPLETPDGSCVNVMCGIDENRWELKCTLRPHGRSADTRGAGPLAVGLQRLLSVTEDPAVSASGHKPYDPVACQIGDPLACSLALDATSFVAMVTVNITDVVAARVLLRVPAKPVKPTPPVNLSHIQTIEAELILLWDPPADFHPGPLRYEVRFSSNIRLSAWQVVSVPAEPRVSLDLKPKLNYTIQVRCCGLVGPPLWSDWSEPYHIYLDTVSYIPKKVVAHPGENVTVYCVFNDHSMNASTAMWMLNFEEPLHHSQYHPVNQWVSQITLRPSDTRMYDLLRCTQKWTITYSQIYVEGAYIEISCVTNGEIDAMDCSWKSIQWTKPKFQYRWADLACDVMEEREKAGEEVGETGPPCVPLRSRPKTCTIQPLRMNCYKLWLEVPSQLGPIRSKPVYLSPIDHVKPHPPTNVRAVSRSGGVLRVSWEPPSLPVDKLQCQLRLHVLSTAMAQPDWKEYTAVVVPWAEVPVSDMCSAYGVQVRCIRTNSAGYWSDWSQLVFSTPQNSRAPERGPDFWRILQDDPHRNQTNVTLLFERLPSSGDSYCVDSLIVQRQVSTGTVTREQIELVPWYSFEWNREVQTVTVEARNRLGSSTRNVNMTLERRPRRRCVRSFRVLVINSTCVSLLWSLLDNSTVPLSMVVQWSQRDGQGKGPDRDTWARLPYTDRPAYLRGDFFSSEEYGFYLYPVFADGEGEPVYTTATRGDPAAYMMLMIISFLAIVLFVTLVISQNQMKKMVWKNVPNPNKCSWAKGVDFKKADTLDRLFQPPESLLSWPLLVPSDNISKVAIVDKTNLPAFTRALVQTPLAALTSDPAVAAADSLPLGLASVVGQSDPLMVGTPALDGNNFNRSHLDIGELQRTNRPQSVSDSSSQSSVTYATVLQSNSKHGQQTLHLRYKDGSGSGSGGSSSDEGNFSANNSDISGSFPGGLWDLESCPSGESVDQRHSCSFNSEISEASEQEEEGQDLFYLGMDYPADDEESNGEQREGTNTGLLKSLVLSSEACLAESNPLLGPLDSKEPGKLCSGARGYSPLYLPQFRTAPCTRQLSD